MWEKLWASHRGKMTGILCGLLLSAVYLFFGFWDMLVVSLILFVCYALGKRADDGEPLHLLERIAKRLTEGWKLFR